ncbi:MAG: competence/damage-inducible protein A [Saprospiraceae bacterium]|nr:competence/damage-inducible protein A [Saprospiraceae bacterium]
MKVHILTIGDEILIGQTVDTNSAWMGEQLNLIGAEVVEITSVRDTEKAILGGLSHAKENADVVLITGGLGPTKDDITKKVVANYFGVNLRFDEPTYERIQRIFERMGRKTTENHRSQCMVPENATLLPNKMGTAPGMWFEENGKVFVSMPGVPYEMKYLMENEVIPRLKDQFPAFPIIHKTILTAGVGETFLAELVKDFEADLPENMSLAYLPSLGEVRLRLTGRGGDAKDLEAELEVKSRELYELVKPHVFGWGKAKLAEALGAICREKKLMIGTAESCTGGNVGHEITLIPGSSEYFNGGVISYSYELKTRLLGVRESTLSMYGAVSEETVQEMAIGALQALEVDVAVAISGIAGPGGGTDEKPVGTVWFAVANKNNIKTYKLQLGKDRDKNIAFSTNYAMFILYKFIQNNY